MKIDGEQHIFEWRHSYANLYKVLGPYQPPSFYMFFDMYHVGQRDMVCGISAITSESKIKQQQILWAKL